MYGLLYDLALIPIEHLGLSRVRSGLLKDAHGNTLEIGIGTGLNLPYYPETVMLTGVDSDRKMLARARSRAKTCPARILEADAERLPFRESEFDTVVATLVFCSIPDPELAMREVYRVLKPGGQFLLLEHVRKKSPVTGKLQDLLTPLWETVAGGCHLNRNPEIWIKQSGFEIKKYERLWGGFGRQWVLRKKVFSGTDR